MSGGSRFSVRRDAVVQRFVAPAADISPQLNFRHLYSESFQSPRRSRARGRPPFARLQLSIYTPQ